VLQVVTKGKEEEEEEEGEEQQQQDHESRGTRDKDSIMLSRVSSKLAISQSLNS
jgi:hypothetical protein